VLETSYGPCRRPDRSCPQQPKPVSRASSRQPPLDRDPLRLTTIGDCTYCQQPVTIVALLATPEAARPCVPTAIPDIVPL